MLTKTNIAIICAIAMVGGFLFSRALLSISMILFGVTALYNVNPKEWFRQKYWLLGVLWVAIYAVSWFWTEDKANWHERFDVKLPVLILPLAFAFLPAFNKKQLHLFTIVVAFLLLINVAYSLSFYLQNPQGYEESYRVSKVLPSLAKSDHIRISMCTALFIIWCFYFWPQIISKIARWFIAICVIVLAAYLHLLAARTGLVIFYLFLFCYALYIAFTHNKAIGITIMVSLIALGFFAVSYIPTLQIRIDYLRYTYAMYKKVGLSGEYSDMGRLISYQIAAREIGQHPLSGVGAGDIMNEMKAGYDKWFPAVPDQARLIPHDQFMVVALGCGIPAAILFLIWVLYPLKYTKHKRAGFYIFIVWLSLFLSILVEPALEVQFGVFVYLFFLLWQMHTLKQPDAAKAV